MNTSITKFVDTSIIKPKGDKEMSTVGFDETQRVGLIISIEITGETIEPLCVSIQNVGAELL